MPRTDGIYDGASVIQGVRTYDAEVGGWTTPDAFAGTVDDPMSQKSYMWNRNNPVSYEDPTGYDSQLYRDSCNEGDSIDIDGLNLADPHEAKDENMSNTANTNAPTQPTANGYYASAQEAAAAAQSAYGNSGDRERATFIYLGPHGYGFVELDPNQGWGDATSIDTATLPSVPKGALNVAVWHSHGSSESEHTDPSDVRTDISGHYAEIGAEEALHPDWAINWLIFTTEYIVGQGSPTLFEQSSFAGDHCMVISGGGKC
jgi:RHS repeat-associated protein